MFAWAVRGKEFLEGDRVGQIRLETEMSQAVLALGTFAGLGVVSILASAIG